MGDQLRAYGSHRNQVAYPHEGMSRLRKRSGGGHMSWMRGKRCSSKGGIAWELYRPQDSGLFGGVKPSTEALKAAPKRLTLSSESHMPRRLPAVLRVAGPSSFVLKIILAPCFSLFTSCYLPSATQDLFFLPVVSGVFAVGCLSPRISPARSQRCACTVKLKRRLPP
jgi:hypothetical protein